MAIFETILGTQLWKKSEKLDKVVAVPLQDALKDKEFVALYFGAQWSSTCTEFLPQLIEFYNLANKKEKNTMEIIYVSSDQSQEEFDQHYGTNMEVPWTCMVADQREAIQKKTELTPLFKSFRIPSLVILHVPTGEFVTEHGVKQVQHILAAMEKQKQEAEAAKENKGDTAPPTAGLSVDDSVQVWRETPTKSIQEAYKWIDYGGGTMSLLLFLYQNPYVLAALIAIAVMTPILKAIYQKPMVIIGFMLLIQRYLAPRGEQCMPGQIVTINNSSSSSSSQNDSKKAASKKDEAKSS